MRVSEPMRAREQLHNVRSRPARTLSTTAIDFVCNRSILGPLDFLGEQSFALVSELVPYTSRLEQVLRPASQCLRPTVADLPPAHLGACPHLLHCGAGYVLTKYSTYLRARPLAFTFSLPHLQTSAPRSCGRRRSSAGCGRAARRAQRGEVPAGRALRRSARRKQRGTQHSAPKAGLQTYCERANAARTLGESCRAEAIPRQPESL